MKVKSIKRKQLETSIPVYDIEVPETSNFMLASGVIVHNSKDVADSLAGALYNASLHEKELSLYVSEIASTIAEANDGNANMDYRDSLLNGLTTVNRYDSDSSSIISIGELTQDNRNNVKEAISGVLRELQSENNGDQVKGQVKQQASSQSATQPDDTKMRDDEIRKRFMAAKRAMMNSGTISDQIQSKQDIADGFII